MQLSISKLNIRIAHLEERDRVFLRWTKILVAEVIEHGGVPTTWDEAKDAHGRRSTDADTEPL